uniref:SpaA isopeptide-forming pilin-related protein n=1 Tax=Enterocloster hominis (ex Hitch et al. 2024) TaxID=1917870 RepID=UPI0010326F22|nr:SpaA isopeptide-forming pilin-related protein [Lachnoclostridium pacaense]
MKWIKSLKRPLSLWLTVVFLLSSIMVSLSAKAADMDVANIIPRYYVFQGKPLNVFGKTHNSMSFYQVGSAYGGATFCLEPGKKLWDGTACAYTRYEVQPGQTVPYIGSFERYLSMVLAYEWLLWEGPFPDASRYGVVQVYYWGCLAGYEDDWDAQEQAMEKFAAVMGNPRVMTYYQSMKDSIIHGMDDYDAGNGTLPSWNGSRQGMSLKEGNYELTLDISTCRQLGNTTWTFPDTYWTYQLSEDGNSITFQYGGSQEPKGTITSADVPGIDNKYFAYIFNPPSGLQVQMGRLDLGHSPSSASFEVEPDAPGSANGGLQLELYRHSETFESNYNIDLEKYCAETNQPLEGTAFYIWEDIDFSQINTDGYTEGEPDGSTGEVYINRMSPEPESSYICDTINTDTNGQASHSDVRQYNYSKTYCMGHPAPEWIECDHEGGDGEDEGDGEDCSCDEENERLRQQWMAEQELCAATCDFHVQNENEDDHGQNPEAMQAMLADRDQTYENYINLEYSYHLQEKTARTGYILHGLHNDDKKIETVILTSAQAGGNVVTGYYKAGMVNRMLDPIYHAVDRMNSLRFYTYPAPEAQEQDVDELRSIVNVMEEKDEKKAVGTEMAGEDVTKESGIAGSEGQAGGENGNGNQGIGEDGSGGQGSGETGSQGGEESGSGNQGTGLNGNGSPGTGGSGSSGTGESGSPGIGESGSPGTGESGSPGIGESGSPGIGGSGSLGTGGSGSPGTEGSGSPGTGESGSPGTEGSGSPGTGESGSPGTEGSGSQGTGESGSQGAEENGSRNQGTGENENGSQGTRSSGSGGQGAEANGNGILETKENRSGNRYQATEENGSRSLRTGEMESSRYGTEESRTPAIEVIGTSKMNKTNSDMQSAVQESGGFNNENQDVQDSGIKGHNTQNHQNKSEDTGVPKSENHNNTHSKDKNYFAGTAVSKSHDTMNLRDNTQNPIRLTYKSQEIPAVSKTARAKTILSSSIATDNNASSESRDDMMMDEDEESDEDEEDQRDQGESYEAYEYIRNPIQTSIETDISLAEQNPEPQDKENALTRFLTSLFSHEDADTISGSLPGFMEDSLDSMDVSAYGNPGHILYTFKVWNHRTEGRIHINKRDLELYKADIDSSFGQTQGDATLEGAVYGLFAAQDIIHPDGKSGVVYNQNDIVSIATTDKNGDASFLTCTEKPATRQDGHGNIKPPEGNTGSGNLYNGSTITSSSEGFGTFTYPDNAEVNGNQWIGRPLLLGNYYIKELSRSEGYELSVNGISLAESNRTQTGMNTVREAGQAWITGGLSDYNNMNADGSWNEFIVENYKTENGYDIIISGYPAGTDFYRVDTESRNEREQIITGSSLQPKLDEHGSPIYQAAKGGEYKIGPDGNPLLKPDTSTDSSPDKQLPYGEILYYRFRTAPYPSGTAAPDDMSQWGQPIDADYLAGQVNEMLSQLKYKPVMDESPWINLNLSGNTNALAAAEILDWFTAHNFYDCGAVDSIYHKDGAYYARLRYDYSASGEDYPAIYDFANQRLYVQKTATVDGGPAGQVRYWIEYQKGGFNLSGKTVSIKEKMAITHKITYGEDIEKQIETIYQPIYETYGKGEILKDSLGNPIPVMERIFNYAEEIVTHDYEQLVPLESIYDAGTGRYSIHVENTTDWDRITRSVRTVYRAVTPRKTIDHNGMEMPYNQYLTDIAGAGVSTYATLPVMEPGSYMVAKALFYPGQTQPVQDGDTGTRPIQVLQRVIKQSVKVTKDISQTSYDGVNTYGSLHNDSLTVFLGLFNGGNSSQQGAKILNQFKFKAYLKSNLEHIYVDESGTIISQYIGRDDFRGDVQKIYLPPMDGSGRRLLEPMDGATDGTYNYTKFFDAMYAADKKTREGYPAAVLRQFAIDYYDIDGYKKEILAAEPGLNSDTAYEKALLRAEGEAAAYLDIFTGLDSRLAIAWDKDPGGGADGDRTTLQCNTKNGKDDYYNHSIMLPYGIYVIAEQTPEDVDKELANRHFNKDYPKEITLPFVPDISQDANTGETDVNDQTGSPYYRYDSADTPEELIRKYKIRFNEENHIIQAHGQGGDFEVYKYGLDRDSRPGHSLTSTKPCHPEYMDGKNDTVKAYYRGYTSQSEDAGMMDNVIYDGYETDSGQMEVRDNVHTMSGMQTAIDGKFASMLVPWTVLAPATDRVNPDNGNVETLVPSGSGEDFNFVAFAQEDFEDAYYRSRLRIEKLDAETGDNILHDGALFRIYAAKRDVAKSGMNTVAGTGDVLFGEAVDWEGNTVVDADGNKIMYPRVGQDNGAEDDLPIRLDKEGIPQYDESQLIRQEDKDGNETGIFRAYSTIREIIKDGQVQKVPVGYIEMYQPLGAGAYVLVEVQAPEGYTRSRPAAFEIYSDDVTYYREQRNADGTTSGWEPRTAEKYQYAVPVSGETDKFHTETVSQVKVEDYPSRLELYKVEDGDSLVGNRNILQKTDAQGRTELSGGFDRNITVNDEGDLLVYQVHGRKEKLEARGDVRDISFDAESGDWYGYVTKELDKFSEHIIEGSEKLLKSMAGVKPLYQMDGTFTGKGIRFDIPVSGARLSLYRAVEVEKLAEHTYKGITVSMENGKVTGIEDTNTGTHREIRITGQDSGPAGADVWDTVIVPNEPVSLYYYDLDQTATRPGTAADQLSVLDGQGNHLCYADSRSGMAYVYDDYGRMLAYTADEEGNKELVKSIQVVDDGTGTGQTIYEDKTTKDDENGLPVYYTGGNVVTKEESWITDSSTDSHGNDETAGAVHSIARLPFGAYILQEERVPYDQGYIQSKHMGLVLHDTDEVQKYFMQNEYTKTAFAKIDVRTQKEIQGAVMTLYRARLNGDGSPVQGENGRYEKGGVYASWISGCRYDDDGNLELDGNGQPIPTTQPHWIDHIPIGFYVLEETACPYEQGYVQSAQVNIHVTETGDVQSFEMEDDFTAVDIWKYDTQNNDTIYKDSEAYLTLYRARLDDKGYPLIEDGLPQYDAEASIFTFRAATYQDGQEVAATGRVTPDAGGNHAIMKYDYDFRPIPNTYQGRYYYTENGTTRLEYLPVGYYVLTESSNPEGYATSGPILITIEDIGHLERIQYARMGDEPLKMEVSKVNVTGGKEVHGAKLTVYPVDDKGNIPDTPLVLHQPTKEGGYQDIEAVWVSGLDGRYTREDQTEGRIPEGFMPGDLKPHLIEYIPEGDYILREETTPYGFLQSVDVPFTVTDTGIIQKTEIRDEIPDGILEIIKSDTDRPDEKLSGVEFQLTNQTTGRVCETVMTDSRGQARFRPQPIGYMDREGNFQPYTYVCRETKAAAGHMLNLKPYEFQFEYMDEGTPIIVLDYHPSNDSNRVVTDKLLGDTGEMLEGAVLRIERRKDGESEGWETIDQWTTGRQGHFTRDLQAGDYRLIEMEGPEGFKILAEPVEFTISDGMEEVLHLKMRNYSTIIDICKIKDGADTLLAGARLRLIRKDSGEIIQEWTSEESGGRRFHGLEQGTYIIHEIQAPPGYKKAEDMEITVTDSNHTPQIFYYANRTASSSGGGGGTPKPRPEYISFKKTDTLGNAVGGAQFTFYDQQGNIIGTSVSNSNGSFRIKKPADGTYTFKETKAPSGYALDPAIYSFTVNGADIIRGDYQIVNQDIRIDITKLDGDTGQPLEGAGLRIRNIQEPGQAVFDGVTDVNGIVTYYPTGPGTFSISEVTAPGGYTATDTSYEFTVDSDGQVRGNTTLYNWKEKIPEKRIGRITAVYKVKSRFGNGTFHFGTGPKHRVQTGDNMPVFAVAVLGIFCLIGFAVSLYVKKGAKWSRGKKTAAVILILILTGLILPYDSMAAQQGEEAVTMASETIYVSDEIIYPGMEAVEPVPQSAWIWAHDAITGQDREVLLPLSDYHFSNKRWENGFRLDVTVLDYGADGYLMEDDLVEFQGEGFPEYLKEKLLAQAGLDSQAYRIGQLQWKGEPYEKDGVWYRDVTAEGSRMVADCTAVYSGEVNRSVFGNSGAHESGEMDQEGTDDSVTHKETGIPGHVTVIVAMTIMAGCVFSFWIWRRYGSGKLMTVFKRASGLLSILFFAGFMICSAVLVKMGTAYINGRNTYRTVKETAYKNTQIQAGQHMPQMQSSSPVTYPSPSINEQELILQNPGYKFWLSIPGTEIDYPVVQHEDNQYYLTHDFMMKEQINGSIFADCSSIPLAADNTVLYGHNMKDGSMFAGLKKYRETAFYREHPVIRIFYQGKWKECPIFSCQIRSENDAGAYKTNLLMEEWDGYLKEMKESSIYDTGIIPEGNEKLVTLSTCINKKERLIIQALLSEAQQGNAFY